MPRPRRHRKIWRKPCRDFFKPAGVRAIELQEVVLNYEEYEVIRLIDFQELEQLEACKKMEISQATLSRLLKSARKKIAEAITQGKALKIRGGNYKFR